MNEINIRTVDLNLLVVFEAVTEERSVSKAAKRLNLTQSAVSQALGRLRALFNDPLFIRTATCMQPTALAEQISDRVSAVLREIRDILAPADVFDPGRSKRRFIIGMTDFMAFVLVPKLLKRLEESAPGIELKVSQVNRPAGLGMIERGEIDILIGRTVRNPQSYLSSSPLMVARFLCAARQGHPAFEPALTAEAYLSHRHLHISAGDEIGYIDEVLQTYHVSRRIAATVDHFLLAPTILLNTDLIVTMPDQMLVPMAERYPLCLQEPPFSLGESPIGQHWHRRLDGDPELDWLRRQITAIAAG